MRSVELSIVGMKYHVTQAVLSELAKQTPFKCRLKREPENPHDENAIKVMGKGFFLGYLRREVAAVFAPRIDGRSIEFGTVTLESIDADEGTGELLVEWRKVRENPRKTKGMKKSRAKT